MRIALLASLFTLVAVACLPDPAPDTDGPDLLETCDDVATAFSDEYAAIASCTEAAECGQVLTGTGCGCTRSWVARNDADTARFYDLMEQGGAMECELMLASTCDCPDADGFDCVGGACAWNYGGASER